MNHQRSLHPQYHNWGETLEQGTEHPTAPWAPQQKRLPTAPGVCSLLCVCAHGWVKSRAQILSMGYHTWSHVTSLSLNKSGCTNYFTPDCFLNEGLFHRREGRGEQSLLAYKEICTETSRCVLLHAHRDHFKITLKNHINLVENGHPMSPLKHSHLKIRLI